MAGDALGEFLMGRWDRSIEKTIELINQMTEEQKTKAEFLLKAILIKDFDKLERLYREYFRGEALERLLADLPKLREQHA